MTESEVTDDQLRLDLASGQTRGHLAAKYGLSQAVLRKRLAGLGKVTAASAAVVPAASEQKGERDATALEELLQSLAMIKLLRNAISDWLRDADDPAKFNIGPRSEEVMVQYWETTHGENGKVVTTRAKAPLSELLQRSDGIEVRTIRAESRFSDPRDLMLKTAQELRQTVVAGMKLARMIADAQAMTTLREELLAALQEVEPEIAERISKAVQRRLVLLRSDERP